MQAMANEQEKLEYLYVTYRYLLYKFAFEILKDQQGAEDAVHECYLRIAKNLHKIDLDNSKKTINFMVTIVKNIAITMYNKRKNVSVLYDEAIEEGVIIETPWDTLAYNELLGCIGELKEELLSPFLLHYAYGYSEKEIGRFLNISENNVAVRLHRAKKKLQKLLSEEGKCNRQSFF